MENEKFFEIVDMIGFIEDYETMISYNKYVISLYSKKYNFYDGDKWIGYLPYNDLTPLNIYFKKELRSMKINNILGK